MKDILTFMGEHPWQTFFLVLLVGQTIVYIFKYITIAFRGWPDPAVDDDDEIGL
jgi:hypothetical protein